MNRRVITQRLLCLHQDRRGVTAMEYGLIAALIAVVIIGSVTSVGQSLIGTFTAVAAGFGS